MEKVNEGEVRQSRVVFNKPVNLRAWHILKVDLGVKGGNPVRKVNLIKWLAWHIPYRISWRWRLC